MRKTRERRRRENEEKPKRILIVVDKRETETKWDGLSLEEKKEQFITPERRDYLQIIF